jgi:hypothetical protein
MLPVIVKGSCAHIIYATIQHSPLWDDITVYCLCENMCLQAHNDSHAFVHWLIDVGHDHNNLSQSESNIVTIPHDMVCETIDQLI